MFPDTRIRTHALLFVVFLVAMGSVAGMHGCRSKTWPEHDGRLVKAVRGDSVSVYDIKFSPDGKWIFTAGTDGFKQWDAHTLKLIDERQFDFANWGHHCSIHSIAVSPREPLLFLGTETTEVQVWNYETKMLVGTIPTRKRFFEFVPAVAISPDGRILSIAENGREQEKKVPGEIAERNFSVLLWNLDESRELVRLTGHGFPVGDLKFLHGGKYLLANNGEVVWKQGDWNMTRYGEQFVTSVQTSEPTHGLAICDNFKPGDAFRQTLTEWSDMGSAVTSLVAKQLIDGDTLVVDGHYDGYVELVIGGTRQLPRLQQFGNGKDVEAVAISPDGLLVVSGGNGHARRGGFGHNDDQSDRNLCFWRIDRHR
jgi:WD40 repeat protein